MDKCMVCDCSSDELFTIAPNDRSEQTAGTICEDCERELVWTGVEVGPGGTCGYSDHCNRMATYATLKSDDEQKRNNLLCGYHLSKLES